VVERADRVEEGVIKTTQHASMAMMNEKRIKRILLLLRLVALCLLKLLMIDAQTGVNEQTDRI
jgi:hypothetical protein